MLIAAILRRLRGFIFIVLLLKLIVDSCMKTLGSSSTDRLMT